MTAQIQATNDNITVSLTKEQAMLVQHALSSRVEEMIDDAEYEAQNGEMGLIEECRDLVSVGDLFDT